MNRPYLSSSRKAWPEDWLSYLAYKRSVPMGCLEPVPCSSELLVKGLFCGVGWARWVSPELRASFPAMLCHGTRGPERRRAYLGSSPAPAPV